MNECMRKGRGRDEEGMRNDEDVDEDRDEAGGEVSFLSDEAADAFSLNGSISKIIDQLSDILAGGLPIDLVIPHPMPTPSIGGDLSRYSDTLTTNLLNKFK